MFVQTFYFFFICGFIAISQIATTNARNIRLKAMSSAEVNQINEDANRFNPEHTFVETLKKTKKTKVIKTTIASINKDSTKLLTTTTIPTKKSIKIKTTTKKPVSIHKKKTNLKKKEAATFPPKFNGFGEIESDVDDTLNFKEFKFESDLRHRNRRANSNNIVKKNNLKVEEQKKQSTSETAPPKIVDKIDLTKVKSEDDILKELAKTDILNEKIKVAINSGKYHHGGNVRQPIDFEEALKHTVPYEKI